MGDYIVIPESFIKTFPPDDPFVRAQMEWSSYYDRLGWQNPKHDESRQSGDVEAGREEAPEGSDPEATV